MKIIYVRSFRNRNIPYDIRQRQFDNQNTKIQKPDIPPRHSSLITNHQITTSDISAQLLSSRNKFLTLDNAFRQGSPPTPIVRLNQINLTDEYVDTGKTSERFSQTYRQYPNNTSSNTLYRPQSPMFGRDEMVYSKLYHTVSREKCNTERNFEENINLSEHISERLTKIAMLEKKLRYTRKIAIVDQAIMLHQPHHQ